MPRILVTEAEKAELLKQREVRALQALAWNEAIGLCITGLQSAWGGDIDDQMARDKFIDNLRAQQRPTNGLT